MAAIEFVLYPDGDFAFSPNALGSGSWSAAPTWSAVDDPKDTPNDSDYGISVPIGSSLTWAAEWTLTAPNSGVTITSINPFLRIWARSQNSTPHNLSNVKYVLRPLGGSTPYLGSALAGGVPGTTGSSEPTGNPVTYDLGVATVDPSTGTSWTIPGLQSLVGGCVFDDIDVGSNTPLTILGQFYILVKATTTAASIEAERGIDTHYLRLFRVPIGAVELVNLPAAFADADILDDVAISHFAGPAPWGKWGDETWSRRDGILLTRRVNPATGMVSWRALDARPYRCSLWFSPYHDLGYTEEGRGVPYLDPAGGSARVIVRNQKAYVRKSADDSLYAEVPVDKEKWDPAPTVWSATAGGGLRLEGGGDLAGLLSDTFSQGSGNTFTSWTKTTAGSGTVTEDIADFLFDATGLKRSANFAQGATGGSTAYLSQTSGSIAAGTYPFARVVHILRPDAVASAQPHYVLQRASDNWYWNDTSGAWQSGISYNGMGSVGIMDLFASKLIPLTGTTTYTLNTGYILAGTNNAAHIYYSDLRFGTQAAVAGLRSPLVTTTTTITRITDALTIRNDSSGRWWDPTVGGTILVRLKTLWKHTDLADNEIRSILYQVPTGTRNEYLYYQRTNSTTGTWNYQRYDGTTAYKATVTVSGSELPVYLSEWKLGFRWTGPDSEFNLGTNYLTLYANRTGGAGGVSASLAGVAQTIGATVNVEVGAATAIQPGDCLLESVESTGFCLANEEILRRLA